MTVYKKVRALAVAINHSSVIRLEAEGALHSLAVLRIAVSCRNQILLVLDRVTTLQKCRTML